MANSMELNNTEKRTYSVAEIAQLLNIGKTSAYRLVQKNYFHSVKIGASIRISKKSFDEWLDNALNEKEYD